MAEVALGLGPDYTFLKYRADAHTLSLDQLAVFSAGGSNESIGLEFILARPSGLHSLTFQLNLSRS